MRNKYIYASWEMKEKRKMQIIGEALEMSSFVGNCCRWRRGVEMFDN